MSIETPVLPRSIFDQDFNNVYEPAEDTFLLLDALERDLDYLERHASIIVECGSGSGLVSTALSKSLNGNRLIFATDINPDACRVTRKCSRYHDQINIDIIRTDLAECLLDRLKHCVDLLIFNPPYVPTEEDETQINTDNHLNLSWAGGEGGRKLIDKFLSYVPQLLCKPHGTAYLIALKQNNIEQLLDILSPQVRGEIVMSRRAGFEDLTVIKYRWSIESIE